jgi:hypothetical protein
MWENLSLFGLISANLEHLGKFKQMGGIWANIDQLG